MTFRLLLYKIQKASLLLRNAHPTLSVTVVLIRTAVSCLLVGGVGVLQGSARGLQDPTLPLPPHWLPKAPVTSLPLRKVCSGVKQKAATLPPHFCSQSGAPHSQPPGHPKKPLQAAHSPEAPLSHPLSPRGNSLAHLPLPMNSHLSRQHEGSGPGVWKPQGGPEHRRGSGGSGSWWEGKRVNWLQQFHPRRKETGMFP